MRTRGGPGEGGGILLFAVTGNTVRGNVANANRGVGIGVFEDQPGDSTGNVLTANVANSSQDHGISAVDGTVDGGGNIAHGNTPPPNCLGVRPAPKRRRSGCEGHKTPRAECGSSPQQR